MKVQTVVARSSAALTVAVVGTGFIIIENWNQVGQNLLPQYVNQRV